MMQILSLIFDIILYALLTSFIDDAPVAKKIGLFLFAILTKASSHVISPEPTLKAGTYLFTLSM